MSFETDAAVLKSLRRQFESCADELVLALWQITEWLAKGAVTERPKAALAAAPDHMNEVRFLLGEIERITQRAERT